METPISRLLEARLNHGSSVPSHFEDGLAPITLRSIVLPIVVYATSEGLDREALKGAIRRAAALYESEDLTHDEFSKLVFTLSSRYIENEIDTRLREDVADRISARYDSYLRAHLGSRFHLRNPL